MSQSWRGNSPKMGIPMLLRRKRRFDSGLRKSWGNLKRHAIDGKMLGLEGWKSLSWSKTRVHYKFPHQYLLHNHIIIYTSKIHSWTLHLCIQKANVLNVPDLFEAEDMLWFHRHIAAKGLKIHCYELFVIVEPKEVSVQCNKNDMVDPCKHVVDIFSSCYWWNFCLFWVHSQISNSLILAIIKKSSKVQLHQIHVRFFFKKIISVKTSRHRWFGKCQSSQSEHIHRLVHENPCWASPAILHSLPATNLENPPTNSSCSRFSDPGDVHDSHWMLDWWLKIFQYHRSMKKTCQTSNMEVLSDFNTLLSVTFLYNRKNSSTACTAHNSIAPQGSSSKDPNCVAVPKDLPIGNHWRNHKGRPGDHSLRTHCMAGWVSSSYPTNISSYLYKIAAQSSGSEIFAGCDIAEFGSVDTPNRGFVPVTTKPNTIKTSLVTAYAGSNQKEIHFCGTTHWQKPKKRWT